VFSAVWLICGRGTLAYTLRRVGPMRGAVALFLFLGCGGEEPVPDAGPAQTLDAQVAIDAGVELEKDAGEEDASQLADTGVMPVQTFIGSPCQVDADCTYEGGVCLTEGFPMGSCSLPCDRLCPDLDGFPTTFCAQTSVLLE